MEKYKHLRISILLIDICFFLLIVFVFALPFFITLYAEVMGRGPNLATTVMVTCYPCVPFGWAILLSLRRFLKKTMAGSLFSEYNLIQLKRVCICCVVIAGITIIAGNFYMPFFIAGGTFMFASLITFSIRAVIKSEIPENTEEELKEAIPETTEEIKKTENGEE